MRQMEGQLDTTVGDSVKGINWIWSLPAEEHLNLKSFYYNPWKMLLSTVDWSIARHVESVDEL